MLANPIPMAQVRAVALVPASTVTATRLVVILLVVRLRVVALAEQSEVALAAIHPMPGLVAEAAVVAVLPAVAPMPEELAVKAAIPVEVAVVEARPPVALEVAQAAHSVLGILWWNGYRIRRLKWQSQNLVTLVKQERTTLRRVVSLSPPQRLSLRQIRRTTSQA
jgi:hypothetical protein